MPVNFLFVVLPLLSVDFFTQEQQNLKEVIDEIQWYSFWMYREYAELITKNFCMVNQQLLFLKEKIQDINSAIFFNLSEAVLKLPTSIITTLKVDEFGYVWFFVERPRQQLNEFEREFPTRMDYFRKGKDHSLQIMGKAWIVTDPEELAMAIDLSDEVKQKAVSTLELEATKRNINGHFETRETVKISGHSLF